ncbi:Chemotaxis protein CheX, a CheY~P-specific phosphatase [Malonomonas rubra DSM 5091]|uniref:Chemotaxis protein CheX, a CheY~P-specific phosphatase n=1 Tax=Malonomonas rubra DSM 5091 TaxID=1122189 RepID=A0A1M6MXW7_MALRU|nr:chemotaxis protein CheX [Malonomonas rubra]SHJ88242.1 Chemotaxis protein CheX, a CheY~P-specific phosphatase [Malonomonas rubra DSM 5091]
MAVKFFGQFLVEKGAVSRIDLLQAIDLQEKTNLKFGEMIVKMGLMSSADVERVHMAQRNEDLHFGDMAVKLGIITDEQVQQVLTHQRNNHLYIGEALVQLGVLDKEKLEDLLAAFKKDQQSYVSEKIEIPANIPHKPIWEMVADLTYKMLTRVAGISFRPGPCSIVEKLPSRPVIAEMGFSGAVSARYLLSVSESTRNLVAKAILDEDSVEDEPEEVLDDSVKEFINIVCGNIAAKAAQLGHSIDITPPEIVEDNGSGVDVPQDHTGLMFPIYLSDGEVFELTVFIAKG